MTSTNQLVQIMISAVIISVTSSPVTAYRNEKKTRWYKNIGCFKSKQIENMIFEADTMKKCHRFASRYKFEYFAIKDKKCYLYNKEFSLLYSSYEPSLSCNDGSGSDEAIDVYGVISNGGWSPWATWSACSRSCEGGRRLRYRVCTHPSPTQHGHLCKTRGNTRSSYELEEEKCNEGVICHNCPIITQKGDCCRIPFKHEGMTYNSCPKNNNNDTWCRTSSRDVRTLTRDDWEYCRSNDIGEWANWERWKQCSSTCDGGWKFRIRYCNTENDLKQLCLVQGTGNTLSFEIEKKRCNRHIVCPIDGGWTSWKESTKCTPTTKNHTLFRNCTDPLPQFGGSQCIMENSSFLRSIYESKVVDCGTVELPFDYKQYYIIGCAIGGTFLVCVAILIFILWILKNRKQSERNKVVEVPLKRDVKSPFNINTIQKKSPAGEVLHLEFDFIR